jgi:hypothetical protein
MIFKTASSPTEAKLRLSEVSEPEEIARARGR